MAFRRKVADAAEEYEKKLDELRKEYAELCASLQPPPAEDPDRAGAAGNLAEAEGMLNSLANRPK
jgi:hypothetical protein